MRRRRSSPPAPPKPKIVVLESEGWGRALSSERLIVSHYYYPPNVNLYPTWYSLCTRSLTLEAPAATPDPESPCVVCRTILLAKEDISR